VRKTDGKRIPRWSGLPVLASCLALAGVAARIRAHPSTIWHSCFDYSTINQSQ
jgi:hypothetical protein